MKKLVVAKATREDLQDIAAYTEQRWGTAQRRRYLDEIKTRFAQLREHPGLGAPRDEIRAGYRSTLSGRHVIFYRETTDSIEIIRVLHDTMDVHSHLDSS